MEEVRESSGGLVRGYVAEKSGTPLSALLFNNQPGEKDLCDKDDCNPCRKGTTKKLSCRKVSQGGMVYSCSCLSCKQAVVEKVSGKDDCNPCRKGTTKKLSCRKVSQGGMVYSCSCLSCKQAVVEKVSKYHGRSARILYTRQSEHISGCMAGKVDMLSSSTPKISTKVLCLSLNSKLKDSSQMQPWLKFLKGFQSTTHHQMKTT